MTRRRVLSLWFPRLGAERLLRLERDGGDVPLAVVEERSNMQVISALTAAAEREGLSAGQPVRDAHAMCANLRTRSRNAHAEAAFLMALRRWVGQFSPWVSEAPPQGLAADLSGCAHLFGGEEALLGRIQADCAAMGLSVEMGIADTLGAAWALARYCGAEAAPDRSGDAIDQEARATRSRAVKRRHWTRGGAAPQKLPLPQGTGRIAAPGQSFGVLAPLPVAALRLEAEVTAQLNRLGLRRIGDLLGQPRASMARRFGRGLVLRLDQAMGSAPEPVSPARPPDHFAVRLTLPEPIGLMEDLVAGAARMLPRLCEKLEQRGMGVRSLRLEAHRTDQAAETAELTLARPSRDPGRILPLLEMKLEGIEAGYGIDMLRLEVTQAEPLHNRALAGHRQAVAAARSRQQEGAALEDLCGRLGARIGLEAITRRHPAESHIPEKTATVQAAAWTAAAQGWPMPERPRPLLLWSPELVAAPERPQPPARFRWRGQDWELGLATGPERIAPEWWLDDPAWRSGTRDYWVVTTVAGARLWLFYAYGGGISSGWFCQGSFA